MLRLVFVFGLLVLGISTWSAAEESRLPRVLLLGDSISIGYTPHVQAMLAGKATVVRPMRQNGRPENCAGTTNGVRHIDRWLELEGGNWDVIHFNFGLHDLKHVDAETGQNSNRPQDPRQAEPQRYRDQLGEIVEKLRQTGARLIFATTTPVPTGGVSPLRAVGDPLIYNAIARQVVEPAGASVNNLYAYCLPKLDEIQRPVNVHFTADGSQQLAKEVVDAITEALDRKPSMVSRAGQPWQAHPQVVERNANARDFQYREAQVPEFELPALFEDAGKRQLTAAEWSDTIRPQLVQQLSDNVYGAGPPRPERVEYETLESDANALEGKAIARKVSLTIHLGDDQFSFPFLLFVPKHAAGPVPGWVQIHNRGVPPMAECSDRPKGFESVPLLIDRGYAVAMFTTSDVDPDRKDGFEEGIRGFYDRHGNWPAAPAVAHRWGSLTAWAWGASRVLDFLEQEPLVDAERIGVIGHSRGGKTSLWAGARDPRFKLAVSNESGCGGAALSRRRYGETVARINASFPHWFCGRFNDFNDNESALPVDQHFVVAANAPRAVYVASADEDLWADPRGEYLSVVNAAPAYAALGFDSIREAQMPPLGVSRAVGMTAYHVRPGSHNLLEGDWIRFLDFADQHLRGE